MHALGAPIWRESSSQPLYPGLHLSLHLSTMSRAADISKALNRWARDGHDILGASDSHAFNNLIEDYFTSEELPECTSQTNIPDIL